MVRKVKLKEKLIKVALRRKPYLPINEDNEADVIRYLKPDDDDTIRRLDDRDYYDFTDDIYWRVIVNDTEKGFVNKLAFEEEDTNGS